MTLNFSRSQQSLQNVIEQTINFMKMLPNVAQTGQLVLLTMSLHIFIPAKLNTTCLSLTALYHD